MVIDVNGPQLTGYGATVGTKSVGISREDDQNMDGLETENPPLFEVISHVFLGVII